MQKIAFVLLCLVCVGHAKQHDGKDSSLNSLAKLLQASDRAAAFQAQGLASSAVRNSARILGQRTAKNAPVMFFQKEVVEEPEESSLKAKIFDEEFISDEQQATITQLGFLFLRISVASLMIHHGEEELLAPAMFTKYTMARKFSFLPGNPLWWTEGIGVDQLVAPFFLATGIFSRLAAASLAVTMGGAFYYAMVTTGGEGFPLSAYAAKYPVPSFHNFGFETPVLFFGIFFLLMISGPGQFSIAQLLGWNDDKSFLGKLRQ